MGLLAAILTVVMFVVMIMLPNADMGLTTARSLMHRQEGQILIDTIVSGIDEVMSTALRPDTNYLNYTNGTHTPLYGLSGKISTVIDENANPKVSAPISMYQYAVLGCLRNHNADGTGTRETATDFVENCSLVIKASTCVNSSGYPEPGAISIDKVTNHAPTCSFGYTPRTAGAVVDIALSADPYSVVDVQYYGVTNAMQLDHDVLVPGVGVDDVVDFDAMWAAIGNNNTLDNFPVDLDQVFFRNDEFSVAHTYSQTVLGLDATDVEVPEAVSIVLNFKGAIETRGVYPTMDNAAADHTLSTNANIKVYDGMGNAIESRIYLVYNRASQLVAEATNPDGYPKYTNTGSGGTTPEGAPLPTEDDTYVLAYAPSKIYDYYNHTDSALPTFVTFKVGDGYTTTANENSGNTGTCVDNSVVNVTGNGNTITGTADPNCDNELFIYDGSSYDNTVNAGTGDDDATMEGNDNKFNGEAGNDYMTMGGLDAVYTGGSGTDEFEVGYETDYPYLVITDPNNDCSYLKFHLFDGDPSAASADSTSYGSMSSGQKDDFKQSLINGTHGNSANIIVDVYSDVESLIFKDTTTTFATACANYTVDNNATVLPSAQSSPYTYYGTGADEVFQISPWVSDTNNLQLFGQGGTDSLSVECVGSIETWTPGGNNYILVSKYSADMFSPGNYSFSVYADVEEMTINGETKTFAQWQAAIAGDMDGVVEMTPSGC